MKKEKRDNQKVVSLLPTLRDSSLNRLKTSFSLSGVPNVLMEKLTETLSFVLRDTNIISKSGRNSIY